MVDRRQHAPVFKRRPEVHHFAEAMLLDLVMKAATAGNRLDRQVADARRPRHDPRDAIQRGDDGAGAGRRAQLGKAERGGHGRIPLMISFGAS